MTTDNGNVLIETRGLEKSFGDVKVLKGITTEIKKGEVVVIIGPSGCGKSTFLRCLNMLETPTGGQILFEGTDLTDASVNVNRHRMKMGMVFQQFNLFPHMTILKNMTLAPTKLLKMPADKAKEKAMELLKTVGLEDRADAYPSQLSGGQKQRVAIARAIVNNPKLLLADEPTGALDTKSGDQVMELFKELNDDGVTIVMITHEPDIARCAKRIMYIRDGELHGEKAGEQE